MKNKWTQVKNNQNLSQSCIKCGSFNVISKVNVNLEYAPLWANYLYSLVIFRFIYKRIVQKGTLTIGLCKKHSKSPITKRGVAYGLLVSTCIVLAYGTLNHNVYIQFVAVALAILFFMSIKEGAPVRVKKIDGDNIYLSRKLYLPEQSQGNHGN